MALVQAVKDGKLVDTTAGSTTESTVTTKKEANNGLDKDAFLQLLVAQMKYQDPLEPTDNTQYISQLATFTQLEETQNMENTLSQMQANDLVGKQVVLSVTSSATGETKNVSGVVDYVRHENNKTYLSVNDRLYSLDDLQMVADTDYMNAVSLANAFSAAIKSMPSKMMLTLKDADDLADIRKVYNSMSAYEKQFISKDDVKKLEELEAQMALLKKNAGVTDDDTDKDTDTDNKTDDTDGKDSTDGTDSTKDSTDTDS